MFDSPHPLLLRLAFGLFASISTPTAAYSNSCSEPWECEITTSFDELQFARHGIRDFCTIEVTLTSSSSVDDPFNTTRVQSGTAMALSGTVSRIWPGAYRDNDADVCPLPISPGPAKFLAGGVILFVGVDPTTLFRDYTGRHWLLRVLTEEQVARTLDEPESRSRFDCARGLSACCRCEVDSAVPRPGVLWVIGATEFTADIDEAAVRDSLTLGSCVFGDTDCSDSCFCSDTATAAEPRGPLLSLLALLMMLRYRRACAILSRLCYEFRRRTPDWTRPGAPPRNLFDRGGPCRKVT